MQFTVYLYYPDAKRPRVFQLLGTVQATSAPAAIAAAWRKWPDADDSRQMPGRIVVRESGREFPCTMILNEQ